MTAAELLREARKLLEDPSHWTKGAFAKAAAGCAIASTSDNAVCWCAIGALRRFDRGGYSAAYSNAVFVLQCCVSGSGGVAEFNDDPNTTHADVLAMFDRAIARAETKQ